MIKIKLFKFLYSILYGTTFPCNVTPGISGISSPFPFIFASTALLIIITSRIVKIIEKSIELPANKRNIPTVYILLPKASPKYFNKIFTSVPMKVQFKNEKGSPVPFPRKSVSTSVISLIVFLKTLKESTSASRNNYIDFVILLNLHLNFVNLCQV